MQGQGRGRWLRWGHFVSPWRYVRGKQSSVSWRQRSGELSCAGTGRESGGFGVSPWGGSHHVFSLTSPLHGVTFLAFGNGAPDVFSAVVAFSDPRTAGLAIGAVFGKETSTPAPSSGLLPWGVLMRRDRSWRGHGMVPPLRGTCRVGRCWRVRDHSGGWGHRPGQALHSRLQALSQGRHLLHGGRLPHLHGTLLRQDHAGRGAG